MEYVGIFPDGEVFRIVQSFSGFEDVKYAYCPIALCFDDAKHSILSGYFKAVNFPEEEPKSEFIVERDNDPSGDRCFTPADWAIFALLLKIKPKKWCD